MPGRDVAARRGARARVGGRSPQRGGKRSRAAPLRSTPRPLEARAMVVFFTGFPGFLGVELLPRVLARRPADEAVCLVQPKFAELARRRASELAAAHPHLAGKIRLVEGDITRAGLGLEDPSATAAGVSEVF